MTERAAESLDDRSDEPLSWTDEFAVAGTKRQSGSAPMTYRIRTATREDLSNVVPLLNAAYGPRATFGARFNSYLSLQPHGWVVADGGAGLIGVGGFVSFARCAYIGLMAVSPERQRSGIGASLFEEILTRSEDHGCTLLLLDASDAGAPLYEKYSFRDHGRVLCARSAIARCARRGRGDPSRPDRSGGRDDRRGGRGLRRALLRREPFGPRPAVSGRLSRARVRRA